MERTRQSRVLELFLRGLRGEDLSLQSLADEYQVSLKSMVRSMNDLRAFLADHRDLVGNAEFEYSRRDRCYHLHMDEFLSNRELFALVEVLIGTRAFSKKELRALLRKFRRFTTVKDRPKLDHMIHNELRHYTGVWHDCESVQENLWCLVNSIVDRREISVEYYRTDRSLVTHRLRPASVMFTDHYFYLIAFKTDDAAKPQYFRVDRIKHITEHRRTSLPEEIPEFDEGLLRKRSLFMWPGKL